MSFEILRLSKWWSYKAPPILFFAYFFLHAGNVSLVKALHPLCFFLLWVVGTAVFGHIANDVADLDDDLAAGKTNPFEHTSKNQVRIALLIFFAMSFVPWFFLPLSHKLAALVVLEWFLLVAYSLPPLRLKERPVLGPLADAHFGHAIPVLVSALVFFSVAGRPQMGNSFFLLIYLWQVTKGLRNILLHQIEDRKNDRKTQTRTFVVRHGPLFVVNLINFVILPTELVLTGALSLQISRSLPCFTLFFGLFLLFSVCKFSVWKIFSIHFRHFRQKFLFFTNDFYEEWMPLVAVVYLAFFQPWYFVFVAGHVFLFPRFFLKLPYDCKMIRANVTG